MKHFLTVFYIGLYTIITTSLVIIEVASVKIGWSWLSTLVRPMGILFLAVNVPLALIGVIKIAHVVFLHSVQHHRNVMRSIREADATPYPTKVTPHQNTFLSDQPVAVNGQLPDKRTGGSGQVIDEATDREADKRKVLFYVQQYPKAGYREIGRAVGFGRTKVGELMNELKQEGQL